MFKNLVPDVLGHKKGRNIKGTVVLMKKKNSFDFNDVGASVCDRLSESMGKGVSLQLISAFNADPARGFKGKLGKPAYLEGWITTVTYLTAGKFRVNFEWEDEVGIPGAFLIKNKHQNEFFLVSLTLEEVPNKGNIHFACNSWIYPSNKYKNPRIFFANATYLPSATPGPLLKYREEELMNLRGDGTGELQEWDRVYDYATYNDLGDPDKGPKHARPILGGSSKYPYPRRGRTGRLPTELDRNCESKVSSSSSIYVPRDEQFGQSKMSDFGTFRLKSISKVIQPALESVWKTTPNEFDSFKDVHQLYEGGLKLPKDLLRSFSDKMPTQQLKEILRIDGEQFLKFPVPQVIKGKISAWMSDEEFAREMLAGVNPIIIRCLQEFPPKSNLDSNVYGDQTSRITEEHIESNLDGLTVEKAIEENKLFILDYHDGFMPYLRRINTTSSKTYASRTILFLKRDGTLKPLAIELSLPHPERDQFGVISKVYLPADQGIQHSIWKLAKAYVATNDTGYHQLVSHWLYTHAVIEPFIIATNRHLSVLHPIYKLLLPHFRDSMNINALARQSLINAGGIIESTFLPAEYSMEFSSSIYKNWIFLEQALPIDLIKRGMAIQDPDSPHGLRLVIEDYPYAVDGLDIWFAIKTWVHDYCNFYYKTDDLRQDSELQSWWKETIEVGHGDKKDEPWWPKMQTLEELIETCTIIIWIASALHAAVNFGQYPYGGFILNRPTLTRQYMPEKGDPKYDELEKNPELAFLKTVTPKLQTLHGLSILAILSRHSSDEIYLGNRDIPNWTSDTYPSEAFEKFGKQLKDIEERIESRNREERLKNRYGPVNMPYTLLIPSSNAGLTGKGIPNSISI